MNFQGSKKTDISSGSRPISPGDSRLISDAVAGFIVFLLALPLSVGIAMASGFPAMSGLMTAAIGGALVGLIAGAPLTIKGPAAGMIVVILGAVQELGGGNNQLGVRATLAAIAVGGVVQIFLGKIKAGKFVQIFPVSAVHGMLSAIGVIIISKQIHLMMGRVPSAKEPLALLAEIPTSLMHLNPAVAAVGILSLAIMALWPLATKRGPFFIKKFPAPLLVVSVAILFSWALGFSYEHDYWLMGHKSSIGPNFLVHVPTDLASAYISPDFSSALRGPWFKWLFVIVAVGSLESLLTVKAMDSLAGQKKPSDLNRDLMAVGAGNLLCGLIGGLPMIAEVVRSSANINAKAQTRWANVFHGLFIAIFAVALPGVIHMIPTAALSGLLVFTGYRLASPKHWKETYVMGPEQLVVYMVTLIATLLTDLLLGIAMGLLCEAVINLLVAGTAKNLFRPNLIFNEESHVATKIGVHSPITFANLMPTISTIRQIRAKEIAVDLSHSQFVDCTSMTALTNLAKELQENNTSLKIVGLDRLKSFTSHPQSARLGLDGRGQNVFFPLRKILALNRVESQNSPRSGEDD